MLSMQRRLKSHAPSVMHFNQVQMRCSSSHVQLCSYEFYSTPPMLHSFHGGGRLLLTNRLASHIKHPKEAYYFRFVISYNAVNNGVVCNCQTVCRGCLCNKTLACKLSYFF